MIPRLLCHPKLSVRFFSLLFVGTIVFLLAWTFSYHFLPPGILRGKMAAAALAGTEAAKTVWLEFIRIAGINLLIACFAVVLPNRLLHFRGIPLGYLPPLGWCALYAATLGTNSFSVPMPAPLAPSWSVLERSGPYEIAAYLLIAASTHAIAVARSPRFFSTRTEPVVPRPPLLASVEWKGIALAALLLLAANFQEAYRIVAG